MFTTWPAVLALINAASPALIIFPYSIKRMFVTDCVVVKIFGNVPCMRIATPIASGKPLNDVNAANCNSYCSELETGFAYMIVQSAKLYVVAGTT